MDLFGYLKNNLNICLNEQQKEAVESCDKRILLEACPGSGKTTTLVARIAYQILCRHIFPGRILTLTFSRASACDMMDRYKAMFGSFQLPPVHFSTIHSFCYRFLFFCERMGILAVPRLIEKQSHNGKMKILKKIYFEINQEYPIEDQIEELSNQISFVKNKLIQPRGFKSDVHSFASLYDKYESYKKQFNLIDFDDMLLLSYNILNKNPELYKKFGVFHIVNVDEAQDTSLLQHRIIEKLSSDGSLFMVGDTDQSIYSFRGAEPDYIVRIKDIYPETKILRLETNYRSTQKIVRLANGFIYQNKCRHEKNMTTINEEGEKPGVFLLKDIDEQVKMTLQLIRDANCFNDTAVLYRNNLSGLAVAWELVKNGIPFYIRDDYSSFFKHFIVRDIFAFFQMAMDPTDLESFQKIYYKMGTAISNKDIQALKDRANKVDIISELIGMNFHKKHMLRHLSRVRRAFNRISQKDPYIGFEIIENQLQYGDYLKRNPGFLSVFHTLKYFARGTENVTEYKKTLRSLKDCIDQYYSNTWDNGVSLLTLHGSKGLEFDNVILIDLVDGLIPSEKSLEALKMGNRKDYEEEVRLFYVGVTRARKKVFLLSPQTIAGKETVRSRFINQFLWQNKELGEGQIVYHKKFGEGIVMSYNGDVAIIMFKNYGCRKLSVKICLESGLLRVE